MAIKMVRKPSETPNITNIDDFIPFRYAYGNQNGYVKGKGNEVSYTINGANFKINSGRLVLQGVETDIDSSGYTITIDNSSEKRYFTVYYTVNLGTNTVSINNQYSTSTYPTISSGDDLTVTTNGIANLVLYKFTAQSSVISNVTKVVQEITYTGTALSDYNISKGTIETRLTNLGFRQGAVTMSSGYSAGTNRITRQGNYCILDLELFLTTAQVQNIINGNEATIGTIPVNFRPSNTEYIYGSLGICSFKKTDGFGNQYYVSADLSALFEISSTGTIKLKHQRNFTDGVYTNLTLDTYANNLYPSLNTGYVSNPIT